MNYLQIFNDEKVKISEQVQNFPQLVIKFILKNIRISAGRALKERKCTLKGQAWYVNVRGSVH